MSTTSNSPFMREAVRLLASPSMRSLARRICPRDYEDVLQDAALACVKLERRHADFAARNVTALLSMIVRHEAVDRINAGKRKRDQAAIDPALAHEAASTFPAAAFQHDHDSDARDTVAVSHLTPESEAIEREAEATRERQRNFVRLAVAKLPAERREQIIATHWDETPARRRPNTSKPKVDGEHPLLPFGTAVSRVSRANEQLRAMPEIRLAHDPAWSRQVVARGQSPEETPVRVELIDRCRALGIAGRRDALIERCADVGLVAEARRLRVG